MKPITFGGTGRDRGHHLRSDSAALAAMLPKAQILALWRGQILADQKGLVFLSAQHPIFGALAQPVFLGFYNDGPVFAAEIAAWSPEEGIPSPEVFDAGRQNHPLAPMGAQFSELRLIMADLCPDEAEMAAAARALLEWHRRNGFCPNCGAPSVFAGAGWRRDCTPCATQHFPRTDPVVIMVIENAADEVLLGRSPGWPQEMYSTLAGFIESGETMEAAVRREVAEEAGITVGDVGYYISQPWPFPASLMLGCWGKATSQDITIDPVELDDALWVSRADLAAVLAGQHPKIRPPRQGAVARYLLEAWLDGDLIPG